MYGHLAQFSFYPQMRNCCENFTLISQKFSCALEEVSCVSNSPASSLKPSWLYPTAKSKLTPQIIYFSPCIHSKISTFFSFFILSLVLLRKAHGSQGREDRATLKLLTGTRFLLGWTWRIPSHTAVKWFKLQWSIASIIPWSLYKNTHRYNNDVQILSFFPFTVLSSFLL